MNSPAIFLRSSIRCTFNYLLNKNNLIFAISFRREHFSNRSLIKLCLNKYSNQIIDKRASARSNNFLKNPVLAAAELFGLYQPVLSFQLLCLRTRKICVSINKHAGCGLEGRAKVEISEQAVRDGRGKNVTGNFERRGPVAVPVLVAGLIFRGTRKRNRVTGGYGGRHTGKGMGQGYLLVRFHVPLKKRVKERERERKGGRGREREREREREKERERRERKRRE
ncbi:uncharacterized protein LOC143424880 [Xylocopa sonorina]|uniref:uncharacterized protein LOC143424880 n=1 Tax=Xylocopa sonorina TaxID=1818115 RepID=UPI00403ADFCA